jgi:hypothetical protein
MDKLMFWAYLHANGSIIVKRWFGDHKDYTDDCEGNDFIQAVMSPFAAKDAGEARAKARALFL